MQTKDLKEYLGIVADMEESVFLQKRLMGNIASEIEQLKIPKKFVDPSAPVEPQYLPKPVGRKVPHSFAGIIGGCIAWFFAGGCGGLTIGAIIHTDWPMIFSIIIPVIWIIYCTKANNNIAARNAEKEDEIAEINRENMERYREELDEYQNVIKENQVKREQDKDERKTKLFFLQKQMEYVKKQLDISKEHLQKIYDQDIIFPKYRNLVMVCSLYEYICAGRFTTLEGPDGAYNCLETEIRLDHIITQIDKVISSLDKIQTNQFMLYNAVQAANQQLNSILNDTSHMISNLGDLYRNSSQLNAQVAALNAQNAELNVHIVELEKNSALTSYYTERTQKELAYMNRMDYLSGRNDGLFWNHPPV